MGFLPERAQDVLRSSFVFTVSRDTEAYLGSGRRPQSWLPEAWEGEEKENHLLFLI